VSERHRRGLPRIHETVDARLRSSGQRYTSQRRVLVDALSREGPAPGVPELLTASGLPQSSVYRNLAALEHAGVVRRIVTDDEFGRYELSEDLTEHHHHLICSSCGRVQDVTIPGRLEADVDRALDRLGRRYGFAEVTHRLDLIGTCRVCAARVPNSGAARASRSRIRE
jgi:Fur family transcriptional regulator, ferric uptake regulator